MQGTTQLAKTRTKISIQIPTNITVQSLSQKEKEMIALILPQVQRIRNKTQRDLKQYLMMPPNPKLQYQNNFLVQFKA